MLKAQKYQLVCPVELSALSLQPIDNFQSKNWVSMADFHHPRQEAENRRLLSYTAPKGAKPPPLRAAPFG